MGRTFPWRRMPTESRMTDDIAERALRLIPLMDYPLPLPLLWRLVGPTPVHHSSGFWPSPYPPGSASGSPLPAGMAPSPARSTPHRFFRRPFPPPSPAKHIKATLAKRFGTVKHKEGTIVEDTGAVGTEPEGERPLDKNFGYGKNFGAKYELGKEVGRGHFGHTCTAKVKKGGIKGQIVAVKIISKAKMTTTVAIEDVRREVKILKALSGHKNLVKFYDACYVKVENC